MTLGFALAYWLWNPTAITEEESASQSESLKEAEPDLFGKNVNLQQLNPDGSLHYRLKAEEIEQYVEAEHTDMEKPKLHLVSANQPPWDIDAARGSIDISESKGGAREESR